MLKVTIKRLPKVENTLLKKSKLYKRLLLLSAVFNISILMYILFRKKKILNHVGT